MDPEEKNGLLSLDFYGVGVECTGDPEALAKLAVHFHAFRTTDRSAQPLVRVALLRRSPQMSRDQRRRADLVVDRGAVYNFGARTVVDHHGRACSEYDFKRESGIITAPELRDLIELSYLMVHSRVGELLEVRGLIRLHCVGVAAQERAAVILAPSGGGKSTLARAVLRYTDGKLLGDDLVLVDQRAQAHPFHSPLGVDDPISAESLGSPQLFERRQHAPKWIVPLEALQYRLTFSPQPVDWVISVVRVNRPPSRLLPVSRRAITGALWRDMVVGLGLPQVLELIARRGGRDLWQKAPSAFRRTSIAASLLARTRSAVLELADMETAAQLVVGCLTEPDNL